MQRALKSAEGDVRTRRSLRYPGQKGDLDVHAGPEPGAQVGGAGEDVAQALVPHELPATLLNQLLHLVVTRFACYVLQESYTLHYSFLFHCAAKISSCLVDELLERTH